MKKILFIIFGLGILGVGYGLYQYYRPVASLASAKADHIVTSDDLEKAYTADEASANAKYNDKIIEVSGKVSSIEDLGGVKSIILATSNPLASVSCEMEKSSNLGNIRLDANVTIIGKSTGILSDVVLVNCSIKK